MNARRFLMWRAELALATGEPLHEALRDASKRAGGKANADAAASAAEAGQLATALTLLQLDPFIARAAVVRPESAGDVSRELRALPSDATITVPVRLALVYPIIVGLVVALVDWMIVAFVHPVLLYAAGEVRLEADLGTTGLWVAVGGLAVAIVLDPNLPVSRPFLLGPLQLARALRTASVLLAAGVDASSALAAPSHALGNLRERFELLAGSVPADPGSLRMLADALIEQAQRQAARFEVSVKVMSALVFGLAVWHVAAPVYETLWSLAGGSFR